MTKLKLMSMQELDEAAQSQDGNEFSRELFRRELNRREQAFKQSGRKNHSSGYEFATVDYVLV